MANNPNNCNPFLHVKHRQSAQHRLIHRLRTRMNDIHDVFNKRGYDTTGLRLWPSCFEETSAPFPQTNTALMVYRSSFVASCIKVRSSAWRFVYLVTIRIATQPLDPWYVCHLTSTSATINDINNDQRRLSLFTTGLRHHLDDINSSRIWYYSFDLRCPRATFRHQPSSHAPQTCGGAL